MRTSFSFGLLLGSLVLFSGCGEEVILDSGAIAGSVFPVNSLRSVYLINETDTLKASPNAEGAFEFGPVNAGWYNLTGDPTSGYDVPKIQRIIITGGQTMQAPTLKPDLLPGEGKFSVTMNNKVLTAPLNNTEFGTSDISTTVDGFTFQFELPKITGIDTFNTANRTDLKLSILEKNKTWKAFDTLGTTALKITKYDPKTKRADAVFTFKAGNPGEKDLVGTNGVLRFIKVK